MSTGFYLRFLLRRYLFAVCNFRYLRGNQIQEIFPYALTGLSKLLTL